MSPQSDDDVGKPKLKDDGRQTAQQRDVLGGGGGDGGKPELKPPEGIAKGSPPIRGGSSQGSGDRTGGDGELDTERPTDRHPQARPGDG